MDQATGGTKGGVRKPSGKDKGWINDFELVFQSKKSGDYYDKMTGEHFEEWFNDTLVPKLEPDPITVWIL